MTNLDGNKRAKSRIRSAEIAAAIIPLLFTSFFSYKYLYLPYKDPSSAEVKRAIMYGEVSTYAKEGNYRDRDGNIVFGHASDEMKAYADAPENYAYAYLLGYYQADNNQEYTFGLRGNLMEYSWGHLDNNNQGATTYLTTNTFLQDYAYELLNEQEGSITVINNKTGEILALASYGNILYDVNDPTDFLSSTIPGSQFRRGTFETDPPGSTFKVITASAALAYAKENNLQDDFFNYTDTGTYTAPGDSWVVTNYGDAAYGEIDLDTAMENSVNCYFANLGVNTGADNLKAMAEKFMISKDIPIPFLTTLHSRLDIKANNLGTVAQTAFGQGNTEITPVHLALIAATIQNNGTMMSPYIVSRIANDTRTFYTYNPTILSEVMTSDIAGRVKQSMHVAAVSYGFDEADYGDVYAKTGTAECADDRIHSYMIGSVNDYSFCISFNTMASSEYLYPISHKLVAYILNNL